MSQLVSIDFLPNNMSKRARRPSGFYASLSSDALDRNFKLKYRPTAKRRQSSVFHSMEELQYGFQSLKNANCLEFTNWHPNFNANWGGVRTIVCGGGVKKTLIYSREI